MSTKKFIAVSAAGLALAASGALTPLSASASSGEGMRPVGSVFGGTVEATAPGGILVEKQRKKGSSVLIAVDTDATTVVSRGGQAVTLTSVTQGDEIIISGTKNRDGSVLASKIIVRS